MANTKKENKKRLMVILLIVLLLALAVGYAAFSDTLTISGTAKVNGSFDVQFVGNNCSKVVEHGCTATVEVGNQTSDTNSNITSDKLTVTVGDLAYPGAGVQVHAQIKNLGSIPAKITSINPNPAPTGNGNAIVISGLEAINTSHPTLASNGTCDFDFTIMWNPEVTVLDNAKAGENGESYSFDFVITYEQDTTNLNVTLDHNDVNPEG